MIDLGPHAGFIWTAYAVVTVVIAGLAGWLVLDGRRQRAALQDMEARGFKRRTAGERRGGSIDG